jgi:hypothetical protein
MLHKNVTLKANFIKVEQSTKMDGKKKMKQRRTKSMTFKHLEPSTFVVVCNLVIKLESY